MKTLDQIANHLEFLGYKKEITDAKDDKDRPFLIAKHSSKYNIVGIQFDPNFIRFQISLTTEKRPTERMDEFIVGANRSANISQIYYDLEEGKVILRIGAVFSGDYSKESFGLFYDWFQGDVARLYSLKDYSKIFLD